MSLNGRLLAEVVQQSQVQLVSEVCGPLTVSIKTICSDCEGRSEMASWQLDVLTLPEPVAAHITSLTSETSQASDSGANLLLRVAWGPVY